MSTSRDNLPAVEEPETERRTSTPTIVGAIWAAAEWVAKRELVLRLLSVVALLVAGGIGVVWAKDTIDAGSAPVAADLATFKSATTSRLDAVERKVDLAEERSARRFEVLYNTMLTGKAQPGAEELKQPAPKDAGP